MKLCASCSFLIALWGIWAFRTLWLASGIETKFVMPSGLPVWLLGTLTLSRKQSLFPHAVIHSQVRRLMLHSTLLMLTALPEICFKGSLPLAIRCGINLFPCPRSAVVFNVKLTNGCTSIQQSLRKSKQCWPHMHSPHTELVHLEICVFTSNYHPDMLQSLICSLPLPTCRNPCMFMLFVASTIMCLAPSTVMILAHPFRYTNTLMLIFWQVKEVEIQNSSSLNLAMTMQRTEVGRSCVVLWIFPNHAKVSYIFFHSYSKLTKPTW